MSRSELRLAWVNPIIMSTNAKKRAERAKEKERAGHDRNEKKRRSFPFMATRYLTGSRL